MKNNLMRTTIAVIVLPVILYGGFLAQSFYRTPEHIRYPTFEHYHFRTQVVYQGAAVDFSLERFQKVYDGNTCSDDVLHEPIHFHDKLDQMTHIHWDGITGGEVLKYYGWNFIGGDDGNLGQRFDDNFVFPKTVAIHGSVLPILNKKAGLQHFVYVGDEKAYQRKDWDEFLHQNLEDFFGKKSLLKQETAVSRDWLDFLLPVASAHGSVDDGHKELNKEELTRLNNLIGNVVIFVQDKEPSSDEVKAKFTNLVPLQDSACGG